MFRFYHPYFFFLLLPLIYLFFRKEKKQAIKVPSISKVKNEKLKIKKYLIGKYLVFISSILMIIGLARPQILNDNSSIKKEGIDIVIALDLSRSMLNDDFKPNRLEKSKEILDKFIAKRSNDRISLVIFGGDAYTKIPLTFDNSMIRKTVQEIKIGDITSNNQTAIGMGIGVSLNRLKDSKSKSKIIILMTDGENNAGELSPLQATNLAKDLGVKIYTVGIGAHETSFFGLSFSRSQLDENLLTEIATKTSGKYFRASDNKSFNEIFEEIDTLEKTKIDKEEFFTKKEIYFNFIKLSLILLSIGLLFEFLIFIRLP